MGATGAGVVAGALRAVGAPGVFDAGRGASEIVPLRATSFAGGSLGYAGTGFVLKWYPQCAQIIA
jgi:hypothetical protein